MSMVLCQGCDSLVNSDNDPECFVEVGNMRRLHKEIILCEPCRERHAEQLDEPASPHD